MKIVIRNNAKEGSLWAAHYIAAKINAKAAVSDKPFVIGLCTGSTPIETYAELIRMVKAGEVSFKNVISFNMDEYVGLPVDHPESYHSFMHRYLFDHIDEKPENIHILDGNAKDVEAECAAYEKAIVDAKYAFIQGALAETYEKYQAERPRRTLTDKIDALVTNQWLAFPIFILLLWFIFWATFTIGQYPMDWIDALVGWIGDKVGALLQDGWFRDLLVDGVIAGVGSVLVFLPNILILYFFISIMEDSGYMAGRGHRAQRP